jgi:hypothetical protein
MMLEGAVCILGNSFGNSTAEQQAGQKPFEVFAIAFFPQADAELLGLEGASFQFIDSRNQDPGLRSRIPGGRRDAYVSQL